MPATGGEDVDTTLDDVVELCSNATFDSTIIEGIQHEALLSKIQGIVGNDDYAVKDEDGEPRAPEHRNVAVVTRMRDDGRELLTKAATDRPFARRGRGQQAAGRSEGRGRQ